ncbi:virB8 family protein [Pantoea stewartii]|uniref:virB8 family protein n=1 Tax=Pantoea stewartii TaxID=66269 RepID=UPI0019817954|nr:type IV secretion system protein [Pantoea stewartii]
MTSEKTHLNQSEESEELASLAKLKRFLQENEDLDNLVASINSWEQNELKQSRDGERKAWRVAFGLGGLLGLSLIAIATMMPLKKVMPPATVVMDKSQGEVFPLQSLDEVKIPLDSAFARKAINDFMLARENYTYDTAYLNYETAAAYMNNVLRTQWMDYWDDNNPQSPFKVYKKSATVRIEINSIRLTPNSDGDLAVATVDYQRYVTKGQQQLKPERWIATVEFKRGNAPTAEKEFRINPLGFQVTAYRNDPFVASSVVNKPTTTLPPAQQQSAAAPQALVAPNQKGRD